MSATPATDSKHQSDGRGAGAMLGLALVLALAVAGWVFADDLAAIASAYVSQGDWSLGGAYRGLGDLLLSGAHWLLGQAETADKATLGGLLWFLLCGLALVVYAVAALVVMLVLGVLLLILGLVLSAFDPISMADVASGATLITVRLLAVGLGISGVISALSASASADQAPAPAPTNESAAPASGRGELVSGAVPATQGATVRSRQGLTSAPAEDWQELDERVDALDNLGWAAVEGDRTWSHVQDEIRAISEAFKNVRYPKREDRDVARHRFQGIVESIKERRKNERSAQEGVASSHKDRILWHIENATVVGFEGILGDPSRDELMYMSEQIQEGWRYFEAHKELFSGGEKSELHGRLRGTQDDLDRAWMRFKGRRAELREQRREEVEARIQRNEQKLVQLNEALERMKASRHSLEERLERTRREEKVEEIQGWIEDIDMRIEEKERFIQGVEERLSRDLEKLQRR